MRKIDFQYPARFWREEREKKGNDNGEGERQKSEGEVNIVSVGGKGL